MKLSRGKLASSAAGLVGGGAALAGGLALLNRTLLLNDLPPTLPGANHDWTWRGWRVRAVTLGEEHADQPPIVLVHGVHAAASSFEMRGIFEPLSQRRAVYAIDLPGFGKSERPKAPYSGLFYAELLTSFLGEVVGKAATLIGSSLSAAYAVEAARLRPSLVDRLGLLSPTDTAGISDVGRRLGRLLGWPLIGSAAFNVLTSRASIQSYLQQAYANPSLVDEPLVEQHWATAHQPNARLAPAAFLTGTLDLPFAGTRAPVIAPILVIRGSQPGIGDQATDAELRALGPDVTIETLDGVGQLPHDEAPDRTLALLEGWLAADG
jgi:pimeloyl-ACP methyl ester carboxylesterase